MSDFWTRRRAAVAAEDLAQAQVQETAARETAEAELEARDDAGLLAEAGLPLPEEITGGEMARKFLEAELPRRLKTRALRALWRSNPVLACLDGLNDYDTDFTDAATCTPDLKTTYQVGKGLLAHLEHVGRPEDPPETAALPEEPPPEPAAAAAWEPPPAPPPEPEDRALPASARRMTFRFEAS